jgi:hypothetical protein
LSTELRVAVSRRAILHLHDSRGGLWIWNLESDGSTTVTPPSSMFQADLPWNQVRFPLDEMMHLATHLSYVVGRNLHLEPTEGTQSSPNS